MPDIIIIGGGLSGLALATRLHAAGQDFQLLDARDRLGGRIKGLRDGGHTFDLGPSWYWPGQPRMATLAGDLGLQTFAQYATGDPLFETERGDVQRGVGFASMEGSLRISGGMTALIDGLASRLPQNRIKLGARVATLERGVGVTLTDGAKIAGKQIVLCCPPRVAAGLSFTPDIDCAALDSIPTWMGGQAKFVATFDTPFWRDGGLSGDAISHKGPLVEIHDASPQDGTMGALFGFVGVPPDMRVGRSDAIIAAASDQLARLFGEPARRPRKTHLEDWATQTETATASDQRPLHAHPAYGLPHVLSHLWDGDLHLGSTETTRDFGGFLEGALLRADALADTLIG